jgi:polysaccharide chain length determinant protein (PEP-CTERM system associated)
MDGLYEQFRIALHSVWRLRWLALAVAWGLCLVGWLVMALIPNSYEAKARVYVQAPAVLQSTMGPMPVDPRIDIARLTQTLTSTENLERAVRGTDLNLQVASERDLAVQVAALRQTIKIVAQQDNVFEITASSAVAGFSNAQNARTSAAVVQALIDGFVEENVAGNRAQAGQTLGFLDEELKRREVELRAAEQRRIDFETKYMGLLPGEGSIGQRMAAARVELANIDQQLVAANSALASTRSQIAGTPQSIGGLAGEGGASGQLASLEGQLSQLRARGWTDSHPDVIATKAQIARLRPVAEAERRSGAPIGTPNPLYVSLRAMLAEKEAQASALNARKTQLQTDLAQLTEKQSSEPEVVAEQARLSNDYEVLKRQYDKLLEDREQVRLRSDVNSKTDPLKFRVIERPSIPSAPATPNRPLFLTLILVASLGAGAGTAFAKSQLQTTFPTINRLETVTGLPVLGSISDVATAAGRALERQRLRWFAGAGAALASAWMLLLAIEFYQRSTIA